MAEIHELNQHSFDTYFESAKILLIDFWAPWCEPCKDFDRVFSSVAAKYPNLAFCKINVDQEVELAKDFQIRSVPTLVIAHKQIVIFHQAGLLPENAMVDLIEQAVSLNSISFEDINSK